MTTRHRSGQVGMALRWPMTINDVAAFPRRDLLAGSRASTLAIGAAATAVVVLFAMVKANRSAAFDLAVTLRLQRYKSPALARLMAAASWPGFPPQGPPHHAEYSSEGFPSWGMGSTPRLTGRRPGQPSARPQACLR